MKEITTYINEALKIRSGAKLSKGKEIYTREELINEINTRIKTSPVFKKNKVLDLSDLKLSPEITDLKNLFAKTSGIKHLILKYWDVSNVSDFSNMFADMYELESIEGIDEWNIKSATTMYKMFYGCSSLSSVGNIVKWPINKANDLKTVSYMFYGCKNLTLSLRGWGFFNSDGVLDTKVSLFKINQNSGVTL